jgi:hypothetical protein
MSQLDTLAFGWTPHVAACRAEGTGQRGRQPHASERSVPICPLLDRWKFAQEKSLLLFAVQWGTRVT